MVKTLLTIPAIMHATDSWAECSKHSLVITVTLSVA